MIVLGVDPGLRATGYGVVAGSPEGIHILEFGVFHTTDGALLAARLLEIHQRLSAIVASFRPSLLAVEDLYAAQRFPRTAILMGHVRGVVCLAAAQGLIDVLALPPATVKRAITGFGAATKPQMQAAVQRLLRLERPPDAHAADALAMGLAALSRAGCPLRPAVASADWLPSASGGPLR